ncbi:MAG: hypothetical protein EA344_02790 [Alkalicoccus sp.]|nr:MAG: hypothetical protein EA344_02790 [Alkalicoccus sp.]
MTRGKTWLQSDLSWWITESFLHGRCKKPAAHFHQHKALTESILQEKQRLFFLYLMVKAEFTASQTSTLNVLRIIFLYI